MTQNPGLESSKFKIDFVVHPPHKYPGHEDKDRDIIPGLDEYFYRDGGMHNHAVGMIGHTVYGAPTDRLGETLILCAYCIADAGPDDESWGSKCQDHQTTRKPPYILRPNAVEPHITCSSHHHLALFLL